MLIEIVAIIAVAVISMASISFISKRYSDTLSDESGRKEFWTNIIIVISVVLMMAFAMYALFTMM